MSKRGALWWRVITLPLLLVLLTFGSGGASTAFAHTSAQLRPATVSPQQADAAPAMEQYNGVLYVGWTGRNAAHNLNLMTYDPTTRSFGPAQMLTDTTLVGAGPNLVTFYGNLYVSWLGTDHRLNVGRYNLANPGVLANKVTLYEFSNNAPALAAFNGHLYLSWQGTDGRLNILSSVDGSTFGSKTTYEFATRTSPSLVGANMYLLMFWEDLSARSSIIVGRYDPSQPEKLSNVITLTSRSQLPVGVAIAGVPAPDARMAWRMPGDGHIRLGLFEGRPVIQNAVVTAETTPYTPTLFDGAYLCWTGTDTAQSVNVGPANL